MNMEKKKDDFDSVVRPSIRGEMAMTMEGWGRLLDWCAAYEQALTATEAALAEELQKRAATRAELQRAAESVTPDAALAFWSDQRLADYVAEAFAEERQKREEAEEALRVTYRHCYDSDPVRIDAEAQGESIREYIDACHEDDVRLTRERDSERARADAAEAKVAELRRMFLDGGIRREEMQVERDDALVRATRAEEERDNYKVHAERNGDMLAEWKPRAMRAEEALREAERQREEARANALREAAGKIRALNESTQTVSGHDYESALLALIGASESGGDTLGSLPCATCGGDHYTKRHDDVVGGGLASAGLSESGEGE